MPLRVLNPTMHKLLKSFKLDVSYVKAKGVNLWDENGNKYLDFISQYGAVPFGYNPEQIIDAAKKFLDSELPSLIQPSIPTKAVELAEKLISFAPGEMAQATFCQSGAEAVEIGIKLARSTTGKHKILSTNNSFHGKTMGALSATGRSIYQRPFSMPVSGFERIPFNDLKALEEKLVWEGNQIAAFIIEPIQGEGGVIIPSRGYLKEVERLCRHYGVLLIVDEIQTGLGRTGSLFAIDPEEVNPDIILLSKALGGGLVPIGVCLSTRDAWNDDFGGLHSSTFANNNFTCSIGLAVLEKLTGKYELVDDTNIIEEMDNIEIDKLIYGNEILKTNNDDEKDYDNDEKDYNYDENYDEETTYLKTNRNGTREINFLDSVKYKGNYLLNKLNEISDKYPGVIKEIRGKGLMVGLEFNGFDGSESFSIKYLSEQGGFSALLAGFLLNNFKIRTAPLLNNPMTLRLQPALTVTKAEINNALKGIEDIVKILYYQDYGELYRYLLDEKRSEKVTDFRKHIKPIKGAKLLSKERPKDKFAFLIHYPAAEDVVKNNPSFKKFSKNELEKFLDWEASLDASPEVVVHLPAIRSKAGNVAEGWLIGVPYSGKHLMEMPRKNAVKLLRDAVQLSKNLGAKMVGLGAYTSVVSRGGSDLQKMGVAITSGNSFTISTAVDALFASSDMMNIDKNKAVGCVVGATGAIGRVCAKLMADELEQIYLVGNPAKEKTSIRRLEKLVDEIYSRAFQTIILSRNRVTHLTGVAKWLKGFLNNIKKTNPESFDRLRMEINSNKGYSLNQFINNNLDKKGKYSSAPVKVTVNIQQALMLADLVISASNSTSHLIGPGHLKSGCIVCDIARPADVSQAVMESRKDVLVIEGGLVKYPGKICFGQNMGYEPGVNLACLSETMLLALEGDYRDYSIGLKISLDDVKYLRQLARKHGFQLAKPRNDKGDITPEIAATVKAAAAGLNLNVEKA